MWFVGLTSFALGLAVGYAIHYFLNPDHDRNKALAAELDAARQDNARYREQVTQHFQRTSELVQGMTQSYRAVYEHLANSSRQLCGDRFENPRLDLPERGRLADAGSPAAARPEPAATRPERPLPPGAEDTADASEETHGDVPHIPDPELHSGPTGAKPQPTDKPA
jgi:uncharacterized membrane-anchored protein YhcB (DUF1043 family)